MTGGQAMQRLESYGFKFSLLPDRKIRIEKPACQPEDANRLMQDLKADKASAADILLHRFHGDDRVTRTTAYIDIKALKLAQDAGEIEVKQITYHRKTGLIEALWRPIKPLPFLGLDDHKILLLERMEALLQMEPTPDVVAEYNLLAL